MILKLKVSALIFVATFREGKVMIEIGGGGGGGGGEEEKSGNWEVNTVMT